MMKRLSFILTLSFLFIQIPSSAEWSPSSWPVLKHYDKDHLFRIAMPVGGIGTGCVSLGGRGQLCDWELTNVPGKGFKGASRPNAAPFFAVYTRDAEDNRTCSMLAGPLDEYEYDYYKGSGAANFGLPRFAEASFDAAFPFGQAHLRDGDIPVTVTVKAFNPLIPGDAEGSGLPVAVLSYELTNTTSAPLEVSVAGVITNFIGTDAWVRQPGDNKNEFRSGSGLQGIFFSSDSIEVDCIARGTMALVTEAAEGVSYRTDTDSSKWNRDLLDIWDDFSDDGKFVECATLSGNDQPVACLAVSKDLAPGETRAFTFFLTWHFPVRYSWAMERVGNYYCTQYEDAWDAAEKIVPQIPSLEKQTVRFVDAFVRSTLPDVVKEAALFNLAVLKSQTVFRIEDGHFMGWEGVAPNLGLCEGSCTHVWNYEVATPFLFGGLAVTMRDVEFNYALRDDGFMSFRAGLPLSKASELSPKPAADGQMGCVMKAFRDWQLSGDKEMLLKLYPKVKKALSFAWLPDSWDADRDGLMEGRQHNTMDVDYFGPNPQMQFWYMGALLAGERMALAAGDPAFAGECRKIFRKGSRSMDESLFNGEYYEQRITDPLTFEYLDMDNPDVVVPDYQLGRGCLVDQLAGQYMAHICGLGYLADSSHVKSASASVMRYNYRPDQRNLFNNMRSFALGDEAALLMASWPHGRLARPFPYFSEAMTGFEYCAAAEMIYEGQVEDGIECIRAVRDRYDGRKRNPFNEPEYGYHYARSMASWSAVLALSGFHYSGVDRTMTFTSEPGEYFWSNGYSWGTCTVNSEKVILTVLKGSVSLKSLFLSGTGKPLARDVHLAEGEDCIFLIREN